MIALAIVDIIYIIASFIGLIVIRKLVCYFFNEEARSETVETFGYTSYYIFLILSYFFSMETGFYLLSHFVFLMIIALNFQARLQTKIFVAAYVFIMIQIAEYVFGGVCRYALILMSMDDTYYFVWGMLSSKLMLYIFLQVMTSSAKYRNAANEAPVAYLIILTGVPALSLYMLVVLSQYEIAAFQALSMVLCILCINILSFYLYDNTVSVYSERDAWNVAAVKTAAAKKQLDVMASSVENLRIFRHDMINHFMVLEYYIGKDDVEKSLKYLDKMKFMCLNEQVVRTGNVVLDSLLNHKIAEAIKKGIDTRYEVQVSDKIMADDFDLTCILGNLIDNAVEAAEKSQEKKVVIRMAYSGNRLSFRIRNTFSGKRRWDGRTPITTKKDKIFHGLGLRSVKKSVEKYRGRIEISQEGSYFCVTVVMYT